MKHIVEQHRGHMKYAACRLDPDTFEHLRGISLREYRTISSMMRLIIDKWVKEYIEDNPNYTEETIDA